MEQYLTYYPLNVEKSSYLYIGHLPEELRPDQATFDLMWSLQPEEDQYVMRGTKKAPRKFQNYVHSYKFSGSVHLPAAVTPPIFQYYLDWANSFGGFTYNGILLNWYPDANSHVSWHPDSESDIWTDAAGNTEILSLSFGATRRFDLRDNITREVTELPLTNNMIVIMAGQTQRTHEHRIFKSSAKANADVGPRINITLRRFID